ncbi:type VI secretion system protein TssL, short form [Rahnella aquatilis]|uniref:Type IV / VI secretion system protein, DotU family n=1 Tax=Rahnella aquatilis (strain ATCC 33071 / DSM 4594 / JCM 1683 / NBRC 105701 / NCIMB 13365 / CIP 78.65) TaxID=745277 RepID=H2ITQ5_RAHAC|nr:type VI secretion system protein TssL, short form [Rahnella aquatilis]AEX50507.1 type IV / VI secretion system protein, DotU family [Rahnella aquatilis CIP 78.65 = ATCC 33071]KFD01472.1 putative membrane protein [Rahnella aquatilis CIP 78.65 = ATCC 33071]
MTSIDGLLQGTWLLVISLRRNDQPTGEPFYQQGIIQVDAVRKALKDQNISVENIDHITYTQCALLDESASGNTRQRVVWQNQPLQVRFFQTFQAGEELYDRIRQVLQQPSPDIRVLTCFQRALALGFQGIYRDKPTPARQALLNELNELVPDFDFPLNTPVIINRRFIRRGGWLRSPWLIGCGLLLITLLLSGGLNLQLEQLLHQWLPER